MMEIRWVESRPTMSTLQQQIREAAVADLKPRTN